MEKYTLSIVNKTLIISKAFEKAASDPNSKEFKLYQELTQNIPDLKVSRITHRKPTKYVNSEGEEFACCQFKNLTYERMEKFMSALPKSEEYTKEYEFLKAAAATHPSPYAVVRRWFVAQFPEFRSAPWEYFEKTVEPIRAHAFLKECAKESATECAS